MVNIRVSGLSALAGGALAVAGSYSDWYTVVASDISFTGWEITHNLSLSFHSCPAVIAVIGTIMMIFGLLKLMGLSTSTLNSLSGTFLIILGLATIVIPFLFYYTNFLYGNDFSVMLESVRIDKGIILCFIGGFLGTVAGITTIYSDTHQN
ncbi:MAG: hypothetical protein WC067_02890 [Candidatus Methanomethylophilaceae archaeon]